MRAGIVWIHFKCPAELCFGFRPIPNVLEINKPERGVCLGKIGVKFEGLSGRGLRFRKDDRCGKITAFERVRIGYTGVGEGVRAIERESLLEVPMAASDASTLRLFHSYRPFR